VVSFFEAGYPGQESNPGRWEGNLAYNQLDHPNALLVGNYSIFEWLIKATFFLSRSAHNLGFKDTFTDWGKFYLFFV